MTNLNNLFIEIKNIVKDYKSVKAVIIFGSTARGEFDEESDIDLCVVQSKNIQNVLSENFLNMEEKYKKNIQVIFTDDKFGKLDRNFIETILREGLVLYGKIPEVSLQRLELEPYRIIKYDIHNLTQPQKMRIKRLLYGTKTKKKYKGTIYESEKTGLVKDFDGMRIGIASILFSEKDARKAEKILKEHNVKTRTIGVWLSKI